MRSLFYISTGHIESSRYGFLPARHEVGFETTDQAMDSLKEAIKQWNVSQQPPIKDCCKKATTNLFNKYCNECGMNLGFTIQTIPEYRYVEFIKDAMQDDCDSSSEKDDFFSNLGWSFGDAGPTEDELVTIVNCFDFYVNAHQRSFRNEETREFRTA